MGTRVTVFKPFWQYHMVDFRLYSWRELWDQNVIRAYSERFHANITDTHEGLVYTFFRQNPLRADEPPFVREQPSKHTSPLESYTMDPVENPYPESEAFFESTSRIREQYKTFAHVAYEALRGHKQCGDDNSVDAADGFGEQAHPQSSVVEPRMPIWCGRSLDALPRRCGRQYTPNYSNLSEAVAGVQNVAHLITELEPRAPLILVKPWNEHWLDESILVCSNEHSIVRMKVYAACADRVQMVEDVFELAIRFGVPFEIFMDSSEAASFATQEVSVLGDSTLERIYAPNYTDKLLSYGAGGEELYNQYVGQMNWLLKRPHARAFIAKGWILSFVATLYNRDLIQCFMEGPSLQVTHYGGEGRSSSKGTAASDTIRLTPSGLAKSLYSWGTFQGPAPRKCGYGLCPAFSKGGAPTCEDTIRWARTTSWRI
ncbi:hypothetical protein B0H17DRAFT_1216506 [Mycena rosella]|uniref:Uncharacterized protein n=1 Tax=Mycena rosella TaxID=1033263 RepID=A0AAD7FVQ0_MYCRO|nr:hypothetical protein B0H17DRAFT_1216506 [Mycena rosella]